MVESNKNEVRKLLGPQDKSKHQSGQPTPQFSARVQSPPPLPSEFKVTAFKASQKDEFKEQEKKKESHNKRLLESKKQYKFKMMPNQKFMYINGSCRLFIIHRF